MVKIEKPINCMYSGEVIHKRLYPIFHSFKYKLVYFWFDIDNFVNSIFFKRNKIALFTFNDGDHGDDSKKNSSLNESFKEELLKYKIKNFDSVMALCLPRILGYVFNPITVFVFYRKKVPLALIFEVSNTFNEKHAYICKITRNNDVFKLKKRLYVSPFFQVKGFYNINFCINKNFTKLVVVYELGKKKVFEASFCGRAVKLTKVNIARVFFSRVLQNIKVTMAIYYEALKLFLKGANYKLKPKKHSDFYSKNF